MEKATLSTLTISDVLLKSTKLCYSQVMKKLSARFIIGIIIIIIGVMTLLSNVGIAHFDNLFATWWPLLIIIWGVYTLVDNPRNYLWASILLIFGVIWQLERLDIVDLNPWQVIWPIAIIFVGASIVLNRKGMNAKITKDITKDERHDVTAILAGSDVKSTSTDYKGGKITAVMGGAQLDLRKAIIKESATIEVFSFWGGIEIRVPSNVRIRNQTNNILGGTEDNVEAPDSKDAPVLNIVGDVIMAGVEVKN